MRGRERVTRDQARYTGNITGTKSRALLLVLGFSRVTELMDKTKGILRGLFVTYSLSSK